MRYKESLRDLSLHAAGSAFAWNRSVLGTTFTVFPPLSPSLQDGRNLYSKQSHVYYYYYYYYYYYFSCFWWGNVVTWLTAKFQVQLVPQRLREHDGIGKKKCQKVFLETLNCCRRYSILKWAYVSKISNKMAGNSKIKELGSCSLFLKKKNFYIISWNC